MKKLLSNPLGTPVVVAAVVFAALYFGALATDRDELAGGILGIATISEAAAVVWGLNSLRQQLREQTLTPKLRLGCTLGEPDRSTIQDRADWPMTLVFKRNLANIYLVIVNFGNASLEGPVYRFHRVFSPDETVSPSRQPFRIRPSRANEMSSDSTRPDVTIFKWDNRDGLLYAGEAQIFSFDIVDITAGSYAFELVVHAKNLSSAERKRITFDVLEDNGS